VDRVRNFDFGKGSHLRVLVVNHVSLDGVLQGPGRSDEDTRDGFRHGGWAQQTNYPAMGAAMGKRMGAALLLAVRPTQL
jgi:hypothetical protein